MVRNPKVQRNLFIANDVALLLGIVLMWYKFTTPTGSYSFNVPYVFPEFAPVFSVFTLIMVMLLGALLILQIASHALYGLAHRPPFTYSLFVISKIFLCIALLAYWAAFGYISGILAYWAAFGYVNSILQANPIVLSAFWAALWAYPVSSIIVLTFPYTRKHSSGTYKSLIKAQRL